MLWHDVLLSLYFKYAFCTSQLKCYYYWQLRTQSNNSHQYIILTHINSNFQPIRHNDHSFRSISHFHLQLVINRHHRPSNNSLVASQNRPSFDGLSSTTIEKTTIQSVLHISLYYNLAIGLIYGYVNTAWVTITRKT